jgi:hypothetical protein
MLPSILFNFPHVLFEVLTMRYLSDNGTMERTKTGRMLTTQYHRDYQSFQIIFRTYFIHRRAEARGILNYCFIKRPGMAVMWTRIVCLGMVKEFLPLAKIFHEIICGTPRRSYISGRNAILIEMCRNNTINRMRIYPVSSRHRSIG